MQLVQGQSFWRHHRCHDYRKFCDTFCPVLIAIFLHNENGAEKVVNRRADLRPEVTSQHAQLVFKAAPSNTALTNNTAYRDNQIMQMVMSTGTSTNRNAVESLACHAKVRTVEVVASLCCSFGTRPDQRPGKTPVILTELKVFVSVVATCVVVKRKLL